MAHEPAKDRVVLELNQIFDSHHAPVGRDKTEQDRQLDQQLFSLVVLDHVVNFCLASNLLQGCFTESIFGRLVAVVEQKHRLQELWLGLRRDAEHVQELDAKF